ncbi:STM4012 family radical SAM protein [Massilia sp. W12]|uniref:STM4012 family radical SAM protein n=1 Tax=Massilia sp. W12 TaxID=3126507 RepID=UPI0030CA7756
MNSPLQDLQARLRHTPYQAYSYSYPHKAAYRLLDTAQDLAQVWAAEDKRALSGYVHIPFCSMRCGFCNLFAMATPAPEMVDAYVAQLVRQMQTVAPLLGEFNFARFYVGGGTPTYLNLAQWRRLLDGLGEYLHLDLHHVPAGVEASPETVDAAKLALLRRAGVQRISLGVQSFAASEVRSLARAQQNAQVQAAIEEVRHAAFPLLNLDLIYGIAGQTVASLLASIDSALAFAPEELYLYPLYLRPQTGLGMQLSRQGQSNFAPLILHADGDSRLALYHAARDHLRQAGYRQVSMRMFRAPHAPADSGPAYSCQNDGMLGFGAGARSYTRRLHYSSAYAVQRSATRDIIADWLNQDAVALSQARYGFVLNEDEQQRRFAMQSLLTEPGLELAAWQARFGGELLAHRPELQALLDLGLAQAHQGWLRLTEAGYARADTIGPWLASPAVRALMQEREVSC